MTKVGFVVGLAILAGATPLLAQNDRVRLALDKLVVAYPNLLAGHDAEVLRWRDGTAMPVSDGTDSKTFPELLVWSKYWSDASISPIENLIALITVPVPHRRSG
jgi:hypothetical protein